MSKRQRKSLKLFPKMAINFVITHTYTHTRMSKSKQTGQKKIHTLLCVLDERQDAGRSK